PRYGFDDVATEPVRAAFLSELVHRWRTATRIDGATGKDERAWSAKIILSFHNGRGGESRNARLADGEKMRITIQVVQHLNQVVDVVIEIEAPGTYRNVARIRPVGDEDLVI